MEPSTPTLQSHVTAAAGPNAADLAPLVANENFRKRIDAELATANEAADRAATAASVNDDLRGVVTTFASIMAGLKALQARFPEIGPLINDAIVQLQKAMGTVANNTPPVTVPPTPAPALLGVRKPLPPSGVTGKPTFIND